MSLYLDTSALVKLYRLELGTPEVQRAVQTSDPVVTCRIAFAETGAAFARAQRMKELSKREVGRALRAFRTDWPNFVVVEIDQGLVEAAVDFAFRYALRGFDAVHLAAGIAVAQPESGNWRFASWDQALWRAAQALGFAVLPQTAP